jgi:hypothetical protein
MVRFRWSVNGIGMKNAGETSSGERSTSVNRKPLKTGADYSDPASSANQQQIDPGSRLVEHRAEHGARLGLGKRVTSCFTAAPNARCERILTFQAYSEL